MLSDARHSHIARVQKARSDIQTRDKAWKKRPRRPGEFDVAGGLRCELGSGARPGMHARLAAHPPIPRAYRVALRRSRRAHLPGALESRQVWAPALCRPCGAPGSFSLSRAMHREASVHSPLPLLGRRRSAACRLRTTPPRLPRLSCDTHIHSFLHCRHVTPTCSVKLTN